MAANDVSLASIFAKHQSKPPGRCRAGAVFDALNASDQQALAQAFEAEMPATIIARSLREYGHPVSVSTLKRHRTNDCCCYVDAT